MAWYIPWIICGVAVMVQLRYEMGIDVWRFIKDIFVTLMLPFLCALSFTWIGSLFSENFAFTRMRALSLTGQMAYMIFIAIVMLLVFEDEGVDILADAMIISYAVFIILGIMNTSLPELGQYLSNPERYVDIKSYLERHDLGSAVGLIIVYKLFFRRTGGTERLDIVRIGILFFILKRLLLL